ncbi:hypothetical protein [Filimonas effusa]|uniref:Uncharacterized protein n=1 Tax=Filimonas effusa TaxID=2508721 RepID=A0A4Q1D0X9_9BACT|nr:hypothetical protein [Filimonas effusa]RXK81423.1 hypothetical protein ESB13_21050 [Filimonas effusa]
MKTNIVRLGSVVLNGVGGPEAGAMDMIYTYLLQEYEQDFYSYISINQIGDDLQEFVRKDGKRVHINIRYPVVKSFEDRTPDELNLYRLEVMHEALMRIAQTDNKLSPEKLVLIKEKIIKQHFLFDFVYKSLVNKSLNTLMGAVVVRPLLDRFDFFITVTEDGTELCKVKFYSGHRTDYYMADLFSICKWNGLSEFIVSGKKKEMEVRVRFREGMIEFKNTSGFKSGPPFWEMMRIDADKETAWKNFVYSLPPAFAAIITNGPN